MDACVAAVTNESPLLGGAAAVESAFRRGATGSTRAASPPSVTSSTAAIPNAGSDDSTLEARLDVTLKVLDNAVKATPLSVLLAKTSRVDALGRFRHR